MSEGKDGRWVGSYGPTKPLAFDIQFSVLCRLRDSVNLNSPTDPYEPSLVLNGTEVADTGKRGRMPSSNVRVSIICSQSAGVLGKNSDEHGRAVKPVIFALPFSVKSTTSIPPAHSGRNDNNNAFVA